MASFEDDFEDISLNSQDSLDTFDLLSDYSTNFDERKATNHQKRES